MILRLAAILASLLSTAAAAQTGDPFAAAPTTVLDGNGDIFEMPPQAGQPPYVLTSPPADAVSADSYYVVFFSHQRGNNASIAAKRYSHSFATFVHMAPAAAGPVLVSGAVPEPSFTISWMPASGLVDANVFAAPELGQNTRVDFELRRGAEAVGGLLVGPPRLFAWGPFRISRALFDRGLDQWALLNSGQIFYKAAKRDPARDQDYVEPGVEPKPTFLNCLAAVGDIAPNGGTRVYSASGANGTRDLIEHYREERSFLTSNVTYVERHQWVATALHLAQYASLYPQGYELEDLTR